MQGAGFLSYQDAYNEVKGSGSHIIPGSGLKESDEPGIRKAFDSRDAASLKSEKRNTGDLMMTVNGYKFIDCSCGMRIKVPPDYKKATFMCPKCGTKHNL